MGFSHRFHLVANAHLDPVWLWDWREGMNEAINTTRTMLDLLEEFPDLKVVRGEAALYAFIESEAPELFARVLNMIRAGRWEPVGGTYIQSDNNLPATETLRRQFEFGQDYFQSKLGGRTQVAWFPDSFGHSAGLPQILAANGISYFAHCRPFAANFPLAEPVYWWLGQGNARILAYRSPVDWYCHERDSLPARLDAYLAATRKGRLQNIAIFYGLGNHGGGPTRRMLHDLRRWQEQHPEIELIHSGLGPFFRAVEDELAARPDLVIPEHRGELGYCLRGCYASMAKFKFPFRRTEHALLRAGKISAVVRAATAAAPLTDLAEAWRTVLFNSFHDILPGSSIERAYTDQLDQIGGAAATGQRREFLAANALARHIDTSVPPAAPDMPSMVPFIACNPHPVPFDGPIEFEIQLDWRPLAGVVPGKSLPLEILDADDTLLPFQQLTCENRAMTDLVWRARLVAQVRIPAGGWKVLRAGYRREASPKRRTTDVHTSDGVIGNHTICLEALQGRTALEFYRKPRVPFGPGAMEVWTVDDEEGSWGKMVEGPVTAIVPQEKWSITKMLLLEQGPELSRLWVRFAGQRSRLDLILSVHPERPQVGFTARLFLDERSKRVNLVFPKVTSADFEVPGGTCTRGASGDVSGIGSIRADNPHGGFGLATDSLSSFRITTEALHVTVARATRYADDVPTAAEGNEHLPAVDVGELRFRGIILGDPRTLAEQTLILQQPVFVQAVPAQKANGPRVGEGLSLAPPLRLLSVEVRPGGLVQLACQNQSHESIEPLVAWQGMPVTMSPVTPWEIIAGELDPQSGIFSSRR